LVIYKDVHLTSFLTSSLTRGECVSFKPPATLSPRHVPAIYNVQEGRWAQNWNGLDFLKQSEICLLLATGRTLRSSNP